ncbi:WD repeat-containing protein 18-like [Tropilaelaps mercedesae]|uniref:WD repeat-containing protein 18-like n=1 Tax=Tropilaelaps mercedesae TaxID=418985 RepID=A0A1V9XTT0_9ACAR|nr:WD repeat-containing protein 18-like [Tropilaelaps mercedesae]
MTTEEEAERRQRHSGSASPHWVHHLSGALAKPQQRSVLVRCCSRLTVGAGCGLQRRSNNDVHIETGGPLATYSGGASQPHTLSFVKEDYIMSAQRDKPAFSLWSFRQYDQINRKFAAPGKVRTMDISASGEFCVAGIDSELFIWDIQSGTLLGILQGHYQLVTVVKFTEDDRYIVSGSLDSGICVWNLNDLERLADGETIQPTTVLKDHTQAITDISVRGPLIASVSTSGMLAIHSLRSSGWLDLKKNFSTPAESVALSRSLDAVFVGFRDGKIVRMSLRSGEELEFIGHSGPVRSLSCWAHLLLSGSDDCTARVWDSTHGHLEQTLRHDGVVTNCRIALLPPNALVREANRAKELLPVKNFQRTVSFTEVFHEPECRQVPSEWVKPSSMSPAQETSMAQVPSLSNDERISLANLAAANCDIVSVLYNTV